MKYLRLYLVLPLLLLSLSACMTSSPRNRGSLSDAMDKSRDDYEEEREVPDEPDPWESREREPEEEPPRQSPAQQSPSLFQGGGVNLMARGGYEFGGNPYFDRGYDGEIMVGDRIGRRGEIYLYGSFNRLHTNPSHSISESTKGDVLTLGLGVEGRFFPLPKMSFFSPFLLVRGGGFVMFWEFRNALDAGDTSIQTDVLGGMMLGIGAGVSLIRTDDFNLGVVIIPEVSFYGKETGKGFVNDFFDSQGITRICAEAGFKL